MTRDCCCSRVGRLLAYYTTPHAAPLSRGSSLQGGIGVQARSCLAARFLKCVLLSTQLSSNPCRVARSTLAPAARRGSSGARRAQHSPATKSMARHAMLKVTCLAGACEEECESESNPKPRCLFVCVVAASLPCARPLLPSSDRSAGQRNQPSHSTVLARPVCPFVCVSVSFPCAFPCSHPQTGPPDSTTSPVIVQY